MKRLLLATCLFFAFGNVAEAQVYGAFGYAPYGGYGRYLSPGRYYRPLRYCGYYHGRRHHHRIHAHGRNYYAY